MTGATAVRVRDVLPRDGFQDYGAHVPTATKLATIEALYGAGLRWIEVTSMVHPRWVPQFTDAEAVVAGATALDGLEVSVFVPNRRGLERALAAGAHEISLAVATTDALSRENFAMERDAALAEVLAVADAAHAAGVRVSVTIGGAFGCPFAGPVSPETVVALAEPLAASPAASLFVADTIGAALPGQVGTLVERVRGALSDVPLGLHLHGGAAAVALLLEGVAAGATLVDTSSTGLGGCPFVPDAPGNVDTAASVAALHAAGVSTGLDLARLRAAATQITHLLEDVHASV
jgi:hydroxymethylglutaryl-CoA lyase